MSIIDRMVLAAASGFVTVMSLVMIWLPVPADLSQRLTAAYECLRGQSVMYNVDFSFRSDQKTHYVTAVISYKTYLDDMGSISSYYGDVCYGYHDITFSTDPKMFEERGCVKGEWVAPTSRGGFYTMRPVTKGKP